MYGRNRPEPPRRTPQRPAKSGARNDVAIKDRFRTSDAFAATVSQQSKIGLKESPCPAKRRSVTRATGESEAIQTAATCGPIRVPANRRSEERRVGKER